MEYYSAKKNEVLIYATTWMQLEIITLSEVKSERERHMTYGITYMTVSKSIHISTNDPILL